MAWHIKHQASANKARKIIMGCARHQISTSTSCATLSCTPSAPLFLCASRRLTSSLPSSPRWHHTLKHLTLHTPAHYTTSHCHACALARQHTADGRMGHQTDAEGAARQPFCTHRAAGALSPSFLPHGTRVARRAAGTTWPRVAASGERGYAFWRA